MARLTDIGQNICEFQNDNNVLIVYKKAYCRCEIDGDYVLFFAHQTEVNQLRHQYRILYSDWVGPVAGASAVIVKGKIDAIINSYTQIPLSIYYGAFFDTTTQTNAGATSVNIIGLNSDYEKNGINIISGNQIKVDNAGRYILQASLQFEKTSGADDDVRIWLRKNGSNVANSNMEGHINHNNGTFSITYQFLLTLAASDYLELAWQSPSTNIRLFYQAAGVTPTRPAIPSAIVNIHALVPYQL